jgi:hypothetical protein
MRVTDRQIHAVIDALRADEGRVTGARLRRELAHRFGARGGVARVYRLLAVVRDASSDEAVDVARARALDLERQLASAVHRAELAEHREVAHQDWAANQIFALRERLRELEQAPRAQGVRHEEYLEVHRALAAARGRVAELEADLAAIRGLASGR